MTLPVQEQRRRKALLIRGLKRCSTCRQIKSVFQFTRRSSASDGLTSQCKDCQNEWRRRYRSVPENVEKERSSSLAWKERHADYCREQAMAWHWEHRAYKLQKKKEWHEAHKESENRKSRKNMHRWVQENPARHLTHCRNYRARKSNAEGAHTSDQWKALKTFFQACPCCGKKKRLTLDHIIPLAWDGRNSLDNLQPLCKKCNSEKGDRYAADYRPRKVRKWAYREAQNGIS
jgi:5-methylcytosine-specific restriction endonuclease McrA